MLTIVKVSLINRGNVDNEKIEFAIDTGDKKEALLRAFKNMDINDTRVSKIEIEVYVTNTTLLS